MRWSPPTGGETGGTTVLLSDVVGMSVFDIGTAREVARVRAGIVDADPAKVVGFRVSADEPVLGLDELEAIGPDSITVSGRDRLRQASSEAEQRAVDGRIDPLGSRILDEGGNEVGRVADVDFDPSGGAVDAVVVGHDRIDGDDARRPRLLRDGGGPAPVLTRVRTRSRRLRPVARRDRPARRRDRAPPGRRCVARGWRSPPPRPS